jgi:prepilin-type N-terminal cleavage/methylation domain-containing protein
MKYFKHGQKGFTLIELLVAIPIAALVMLATGGVIVQVIRSGNATSQMTAVRQVQNAGRWISLDGLQADSVSPSHLSFPCTFEREDPDTGFVHRVVYSLVDMESGSLKRLQRAETVGSGTAMTRIVAYGLDASGCSISWKPGSDDSVFVFRVRATIGQRTETRTYEVTPRPARVQ